MSGAVNAVTQPQALDSQRNQTTDAFAKMLSDALGSGGNIGTLLQNLTRTNAYTGQLTAPQNAGQNTALSAGNQAFAQMFGINPAQNAIGSGTTRTVNPIIPPGPPQLEAGGSTPSNPAGISPGPPQLVGDTGAGVTNPHVSALFEHLLGPAASTIGPNVGGDPIQKGGNPSNPHSGSNPVGTPTGSTGSGLNPFDPGGFGGSSGATTRPYDGMGAAGALTGPISTLPGAGAADNLAKIASQYGLNLPPQILAMMTGNQEAQAGQQSQINQFVNTGNPYLDLLSRAGMVAGNSSVVQSLQSLAATPGASAQGSNYLATLLQNPATQKLLAGGQGSDLSALGTAISGAAQPGLDRNIRDLREKFSVMGLRDGTDINAGASDLIAQNQSNITAQLAQLAPQINAGANQTSLGALSALGGIGANLGSIGQGDLSARIAALTGAGNLNLGQANTQTQALAGAASGSNTAQGNALSALSQMLGTTTSGNNNTLNTLAGIFGGQQSNQTAAALAQPGAASTLAQLPGVLSQQNYNLNAGAQATDQAASTNAYNAWLQQQGLTPQILQFLSGAPAQQYGSSLLDSLSNAGLAGAAVAGK